MAITAQQVKELRDKTGAGMMDCKKALTESDGDFEKAIETLRKKGASVAAKRAERAANEGIVLTRINGSKGYILEVNCETDFVAKSDDFVNFANLVLEALVANEPNSVEELLALSYDNKNLNDELTNVIGKIGEKIEISRFKIVNSEDGLVVDYIHHGSKLGVLMSVGGIKDDNNQELFTIIKDFAMQVAAMNPIYLYKVDVPQEVLDKETEIYKELARKEGKPEHILDKIAEGRLNKYYQENCLFEQSSVKDNSKTVGQILKEFNDSNNSNCKLNSFLRYHLSDDNK